MTGFTDGEGCFLVSITENKNSKLGWQVRLYFSIGLHIKDKPLLEQIKILLRHVGSISKQGSESVQFKVQSIKEFKIIIDHLDKYPLITKKWADYQLFRHAYELMLRKEHLTYEGLRQIISIKASMNRGLSEELKIASPDVVTSLRTVRPLVKNQKIKDPNWLAGFTSAEGCFIVNLRKDSKYKTGFKVLLKFIITQHARDECLLKSLMEFLYCGNVTRRSREEAVDFIVTKLSDINNKIIPLFKKCPIHGEKSEDFQD